MSGVTQPSKFSVAWIHNPHTLGLERLIRKFATPCFKFYFCMCVTLILVTVLFLS